MGVISFGAEHSFVETFIAFGRQCRRSLGAPLLPRSDHTSALIAADGPFMRRRGNDRRLFLSMNCDTPRARLAAVANRDMRDSDGQHVGCIALFDSIDSFEPVSDLLELALTWLREEHGLRRVWAPIDFDIWNGQGLMTAGFDERLFPGEPFNPPHYAEFFVRFGFHTRQSWHVASSMSDGLLESIAAEAEPRARRLRENGYDIRPFGTDGTADVAHMHALVTHCFSRLPGFTPLTLEYFRELLSGTAAGEALRTVSFVCRDKQPIAFAGAWPGSDLSMKSWADTPSKGAAGSCFTSAVSPALTLCRSMIERALLSSVASSVRSLTPESSLVILSGRHAFAGPSAMERRTQPGRHEYALFEINT